MNSNPMASFCSRLMIGLLVLQSAFGQTAPAAPESKPAESRPSDEPPTVEPVHSVQLVDPLGHTFALRVGKDESEVFLLGRFEDKLRVVQLDATTGKITRTIVEQPVSQQSRRDLWLLSDRKRIMMFGDKGDELQVIEIATGNVSARLSVSEERPLIYYCCLSADGAKVMAGVAGAKLAAWDLASGKRDSLVSIAGLGDPAIVMPFPGADDKHTLIMAGTPGDPPKLEALVVRHADGHVDVRKELSPLDRLAGQFSAKHCYLFRQPKPEKIAWTSAETWDRATLKPIGTQELKPDLTTIDYQFSPDGEQLYVIGYMVQPLFARDMKQARWTASFGPGLGASVFGLSTDGKTLIALMGTWFQGSLPIDRVTVFKTR